MTVTDTATEMCLPRLQYIDPVDHTKVDLLSSALAVERVKGCTNPIRLTGSVEVSVAGSGDVIHRWSSKRNETHGFTYVPCKTRRASKCPSCAHLYQGDAYRLIVDGLRGGDFIDVAVKDHPALFVTFTAPSFGPVHTQRKDQNGTIAPCRPRRGGEVCEHGNELSCSRRHQDDDPCLGSAICPECFDYQGAVIFNAHASKLWRQTRIDIDRSLAKHLGMTVKEMKADVCRTQFIKITEYQKRGLVHFHVAIRIDGPDGSTSAVSTGDLIAAIKDAHGSTEVQTIDGQSISWGEQLDIKIINTDVEREKLAGYFAKYATKGSDAKGLLNTRVRYESQIDLLPVNNHQAQLIRTAWKLGNDHEELNTARWAHQFGSGGHFLTKSRGWSTTFKALRKRRSDFHAELQQQSWQALSPQAQLVIESRWEYSGAGYNNATEAHLAALRSSQFADKTATTAEEAA